MAKVKIVKSLTDKKSLIGRKKYPEANEKANQAEKKAYPKGYEELKKKERGLKKHELMGKIEKSGKVEVEKKFKSYAKEILAHEKVEKKVFKGKNK
jgi:hypothetical protein